MQHLDKKINTIILDCNKQINNKIFGTNYLEKLKYLLIDQIENYKIKYDDLTIVDDLFITKNVYGDNHLEIKLKYYNESVTKMKKNSLNDTLIIVLKGFKTIDFFKDMKTKDNNSLGLSAKNGIVYSKNTIISEKINKDSIVLYITNNRKVLNIDIEK